MIDTSWNETTAVNETELVMAAEIVTEIASGEIVAGTKCGERPMVIRS